MDDAFEIIRCCMPLIGHGVKVFQVGWGAVRGDSGPAISSAIAAVMSAIFIANLNIKSLKARRYADTIGLRLATGKRLQATPLWGIAAKKNWGARESVIPYLKMSTL